MHLIYPFLKVGMPFEYIGAIISVLIVGCIYLWQNKKPKEWYYIILLLGYFLIIFGKTVIFRKAGAVEVANTYPFWSYVEGFTNRKYVLVQILLNILLFLPIVFLGGGIFKNRRLLKVVLCGFSISLIIELLQLIFEKGLFEFDDIFHNTIGSVFGLFIQNGIRRLRIGLSKTR